MPHQNPLLPILLALILTTTAVHAEELISEALLADIRQSSFAYHEKLRNYDCTYTEILRSDQRNLNQESTKRLVEDSLGQIRMESDIRQLDSDGNVTVASKTLYIYDLRKEIRCQFPRPGDTKTPRNITITRRSTIARMIQPKSFFTASGRPFYELIDILIATKVPIYGKNAKLDDYPGTLVEFSYDEILGPGDILHHEYLLNMGEHFFPMRQVTFFNKKRFLVLQPSPQLVYPGILFPIEGTKITYNVASEKNELTSITNMSVSAISINTDIPPNTFSFDINLEDNVTDLRTPAEPTPKGPAQLENAPIG
ncbi:MAG: hypothetical protein VCD00_18230 [Candidatus Hydrogenedentota bacterium]